MMCKGRADRIIDLRDTDKSRYFSITEFNSFIIQSPSLLSCLNHSLIYHFSLQSVVSITHVQNITGICSKTRLDRVTTNEQTIICKQLLGRSRGGLSANEKDEKKMHRMITWFVSASQMNYLLATDKFDDFAQPRLCSTCCAHECTKREQTCHLGQDFV